MEPATPPAAPPPETPPQPAAAPPPAAATVATAHRTERETSLEDELRTERETHAVTAGEKKEREKRIAELEDEIHRLKSPPTPAAKKAKTYRSPFDFR